MRNAPFLTGLIAALLLLSLAPAGTGLAQTAGVPVATGLNAPRGMSMGSDGNLYVAEAGTGGDMAITQNDETIKVGPSGRITRIAPDGTKSVAIDELLSADIGGEVSGPNDVVFANGMLWITGAYFDTANGAPSFGVLKGDPSTGAVTTVADLQAYEVANNPDPYLVESNPYGLAFGPDGMLWVNDAAGNDLLEIDPSTGAVSLITTFEGIALPDIPETFNPDRGGAHESDPVPTGIAFAPDGHAFVGFLTGFPFMEGAAKVVHVDHDGEVSDAVTGLTMVVDVEVGPNDDIYATEFGRFSLTTTPPGFQANSGRVVRSLTNGTLEVIASGLNEPNGIALDKSNGNLYVVTNSNSPAGTGQVLLYSPGGGGVIGMPVTGEGDTTFLVAAVLAAILLIMGGVALRTLQARRTH